MLKFCQGSLARSYKTYEKCLHNIGILLNILHKLECVNVLIYALIYMQPTYLYNLIQYY